MNIQGEVITDPVAQFVGDRRFKMLVDGDLCEATDGSTFETVDPSTGRLLTEVPQGTDADIDRAVAAAKRAQPAWNDLGLAGRRDLFGKLSEIVTANAEELAMIDAIDCGNPYPAALADVRSTLARMRDWPAVALTLTGQTYPASPGNLHYSTLRPYGVVGRIIPFNHPALFAIGKMLPSLIAGNTIVIKPADQTSLSALAFGELIVDLFPPGVVNIVSGAAATGDAIVRHPDVKRIAFTGSVATAMKIQKSAANHAIKHLSLELGGKNAMIVMPDADLATVVKGAVDGMNFALSQGQSCGSNSRVFVHDALYEDFLEASSAMVRAFKIARAYDDVVDMGPLVTQPHFERVLGYVAAGRDEGARLVTGGNRPTDLGEGFFLEPTIFADVDMSMRIAREEIFGPVMSVFRWSDYDRMIEQANDVDLGLTASVWTNDLHLAHKTAERLEAGYVWINNSRTHYWGTPFGGFKNSGLGREESIDELLSYYEVQAVHTIMKDPHEALRALTEKG